MHEDVLLSQGQLLATAVEAARRRGCDTSFQAVATGEGTWRVLTHPGLPDDDNTYCAEEDDITALHRAGYIERWAVAKTINFRVTAKGFTAYDEPRAARQRP